MTVTSYKIMTVLSSIIFESRDKPEVFSLALKIFLIEKTAKDLASSYQHHPF